MKKVVRLTESELNRLVKRIVNFITPKVLRLKSLILI